MDRTSRAAGAALLAALGGCAATVADFRMSSVGAGEAAIGGRLTILYNGNDFTQNCLATFGDERYKLSPGGIVLFHVARGWTSLSRIDCKDTSMQHVRIRGAHFYARGDGWVTDFGDVAITWNNAGGFKATSMFGLVGALIDESGDDGAATVEVGPPVGEVRDAFRTQTRDDGRWVAQPLSQPAARALPGEAAPAAGGPGYFCASGPGERAAVSVCEREQPACEHARSVLGAAVGACARTATAWCFASAGTLRCAQTQAACDAQNKSAVGADRCGEQY